MKSNVVLRSCDNVEFRVDEEIVRFSGMLCMLLDRNSPFEEAISRTVELPIKSKALKRAIDYLEHRYKYSRFDGPVPDFEVCDTESLDLLSVSFYLKI